MKQLNAIYWFHSLNMAAWSLIGIFVPIYFLTLGYSVSQVLIFYIYGSVAVFLSFVVAGLVARRFGMKKTLVVYLPFLFAFLGMMYSLKYVSLPLWLVALGYGLQTALYFLPLNTLFAQTAKTDKMGSSVGKLFAFPQIASLFGPMVGAAVIATLGFPVLFLVSIAIYLFSAFLLANIKDHFPVIEFRLQKITELVRKSPRYALAQCVEFFQVSAESVIWPVFIYLSFGNILTIGLLGTLLEAGSAMFTLFVGNRVDRTDKKIILKAGAAAMSVIWLARFYLGGELVYYILTALAGFFGILIWVPFSTYIYNLSKDGNTAEFMVFREFFILIGRLLLFGLALLVVESLDTTFLATALANLLFFAL